jgi:hypothetical protein
MGLVCLVAALSVVAVSTADADVNFGFESTAAEESTSVAGLHPDVTTTFVLNSEEVDGRPIASGRVENVYIQLPPGLVGYPDRFPTCSLGDFNAFANCSAASQIGLTKVQPSEKLSAMTEPLYNLDPGPNEIARFGFYAAFYPIIVDISVRTGSDYGVTATVHDASGQAALISSSTTLWGVPADPIHDPQRLTAFEGFFCEVACLAPEGKRSSGLSPRPFLSNPSACEEQVVKFAATTYQIPGQIFTGPDAALPPITDCEDVPFDPSLDLETTSHRAGAPTGVTSVLRIPQNDAVNLPASSALRAAKVTLPQGMTLNPGAAAGLETCSDEQVAFGKEVDAGCPAASRLGSATIVSPSLPEPLHGSIYQRTSAPGDLFRIWLVTDDFGLHLKLPGEIKADPTTGQLTVEFDQTPQLPTEEIKLEFKAGDRAPLKNPDACGSYSASYQLTPWSTGVPVAGETEPIAIDQGCGGGGFSPTLEAGVTNPVAGIFSPFIVNVRRDDGQENVSAIDLTLPKGELAKLRGVPLCGDAAASTGDCPAASRIGSVAVAAGNGDAPLWIPQEGKSPAEIFLAGAYKEAPYSIVTRVPAQAGPFDLGTVVVRGGIYVDPNTAQVTVKTDALPQILEGVPVFYRTIHAAIDRKKFAVNPTNCREMKVAATVASIGGATATPSDRFQVGECAALKFNPKLSLKLKGGTQRAQYPALSAVLKTRKGEANLRRVAVALPPAEFLAQEHINTVCTRVQFADDACPKGSIYGKARAVTPLLDKPLEGPVFLRSSSNPLPDLVVALKGQLDINLVGRIDTSAGGGIRATFHGLPDAPVTKFVLRMKGGSKSLIVNSTDVCASKGRATVKMAGQNGKQISRHPSVGVECRS